MLQGQAPAQEQEQEEGQGQGYLMRCHIMSCCPCCSPVVAGAIDYRSLRLSHAPFCCQIKVISVAFMWPGRVPDNNCLPSFALLCQHSTASTSAHPPRSLPVVALISGGTLNFPTHSHVGLTMLLPSMCVWERASWCGCVCVSLCKFNKCRFVLRELGARVCILVLPHTSRA